MNIRCTYCQHTFNLPRDFIAQAVTEAEEKRQKYYGVECINCRKLIKVQMKRFMPRDQDEQEETETTEDGS
jgi:hypothetical protein